MGLKPMDRLSLNGVLIIVFIVLIRVDHSYQGRGCVGRPEFYAETISLSRQKDIVLYYTQHNITSVKCCAKYCEDTEFCTTAVFDPKKRTCALAYISTVKCYQLDQRVSNFDSQELTAIHCIQCNASLSFDECQGLPQPPNHNKNNGTNGRKPVSVPDSKPQFLNPNVTEKVLPSENTTSTKNSSGNDLPERKLGGIITEPKPCFEEFPQKTLVGAGFAIEKEMSLQGCKCLCASSWLQKRYEHQCKSFQYYPSRKECYLNKGDHIDNNFALAVAPAITTESYWMFPCSRTEQEITQYILKECQGLLPPPDSAPKPSIQASGPEPCFEEVKGYLITGVAGGLEHNVSQQECKCLCANSQQSGRYSFACQSAMYYPKERDCVLNVESRLLRPDLFRKDPTGFEVYYMGIACRDQLFDAYRKDKCPLPGNQTFHEPSLQASATSAPNATGGPTQQQTSSAGNATATATAGGSAATKPTTPQALTPPPAATSKPPPPPPAAPIRPPAPPSGPPAPPAPPSGPPAAAAGGPLGQLLGPQNPLLNLPRPLFTVPDLNTLLPLVGSLFTRPSAAGQLPIPLPNTLPVIGSSNPSLSGGLGSSSNSGILPSEGAPPPGAFPGGIPTSFASIFGSANPAAVGGEQSGAGFQEQGSPPPGAFPGGLPPFPEAPSAPAPAPVPSPLPSPSPSVLPVLKPETGGDVLPKVGNNNDACYAEIPNYILSGEATTMEANISIEACKCHCIHSRQRYGFNCLSMQYYYDSNTCILNDDDRLHHPDRFRKIFGMLAHSYFDNRCISDSKEALNYSNSVCGNVTESATPRVAPPSQSLPVTKNEPCSFSAYEHLMYRGTLIERTIVVSSVKCFQACAKKNCKSVNMIEFAGSFSYCELFTDAPLRSASNDAKLVFNKKSTHFDGIQCSRLV